MACSCSVAVAVTAAKVPATLVGTATVTLLPLLVVTKRLAPPLMLYVNVYGAVDDAPVNVIRGAVEFWQTLFVPAMLAVGRGFTVIVALPVCACEQVYRLPS